MLWTSVEPRRARQLRNVAVALGTLGALWAGTNWALGTGSSNLFLAALGVVAAGIALLILKNWRSGVYLFLVWVLFEDLLRKYLGNNMLIYFGKDLLVGVIYVSLLFASRRGREPQFRPPFLLPLALFFGLGICQVFNPNSPSLFYGFLGLKLYLYYVPLMFVGYALIRSKTDLDQFLIANLALAGLIALLGIVQAIVGLDFLNPTVLAPDIQALGRLTRYSPITGVAVPRPSSVFVSDGRFASYLAMMWVFGIGAAGYLLLRRHRAMKVMLVCAALIATGILLSGSRGAFMYTLVSSFIMAAAFSWSSAVMWWKSRRLTRAIRIGFSLAGTALLITLLIFPQAVGARWRLYSETLDPRSPSSELAERAWNYPINNFLKAFSFPAWPWGYGIGTGSLGGQYVTRILGAAPTGIGVESGYGTILLELGIGGLLLWLAWTFAVVRSASRITGQLRGTPYFPIAFGISWFAFLLLFPFTYGGLASYQNFVLNTYLWLSVGILYRLVDLDKSERRMRPSQARVMNYG